MKYCLALLISLAMSCAVSADRLYKWVDENGITHYGDSVPAKYATHERKVLNEQGVAVETLARQKTEAELIDDAARQAELDAQRELVAKQAERDRILLDTYLSVEEIGMLRDRRLMAIEAQVGVIRQYLGNLQDRWEDLESETRNFNFPYSEISELPPLPEDLAQLIIHTERAMAEHMQTVQLLRKEQEQIRFEFAKDTERFVQLKTASTN